MSTKLTDLLGSYDNLNEAPRVLNHPSNILAVTISFMLLTWACAVFRLYTRFFIVRAPGWDDLFIILSVLSTSAGSISICVAANDAGMGRHFILLGAAQMTKYLKIFYIANATYPGSAGFIKLALLFQYLRVYDAKSPFRLMTMLTIVIVAIWSLAFSALSWVPCMPVSAYWDLTIPATRWGFGTEYAGQFVTIYTVLTASNMALDMVVLGLAAPLLLVNKSDNVSRWSLLCLFGLGSAASIFSVWRMASIIQTRATTQPTFDPTWYGSTPIVLAALEVDVATISASIPVFWPILKQLHMNQILVTREIKVTLEDRRINTGGTFSDPDDDGIELQRSESGLQGRNSRGEHYSDHYNDPYVAEQVNPFQTAAYGTKSEIDITPLGRNTSVTVRGKTLEHL